ncbi:sulfide:quinone oxidoreductase, mitochondrial [Drosophila rhopaloa]|uniref:FAD/NAD(P)-binding domain-containing protein n=1 Tax=Drosophila rhopaloa TaxID=1041015 RepID=A0ABM5I846_DRORH|nr:sulfide:quinone oxidoreductase, mitochondrial [Drosophila rhopaloa]
MNRRLPGAFNQCHRLLFAVNNHATPAFSTRFLSTSRVNHERQECQVLVVGGGTGGCAMAAKLSSRLGSNKVIVLEPEEKHYYQPMFTLIGGGMKRLDQSHRQMSEVLPKKAKWVKEKAVEFDPDNNSVSTSGGKTIKYDFLVIATGMQLKYEKIPGLVEALETPDSNVCSIYSPKYVDHVYECLRRTYKGNAIFTFPHCPIKCAGAPQKIAYISEHYFRKMGRRDNVNIIYNTSLPVIFGVKHYADALMKLVKKRNITLNVNRNLVEVRHRDNIAVFEDLTKPGQLIEETYSLLHVTPPMTAPDVVANCKQLVTPTGFVDVDQTTLQHNKYSNVFSIGDSSSAPNSKTAAAAAAQSPVVFRNLMAAIEGKSATDSYDGYSSCPIVTGYSSCILAEFDYTLTPVETFPVDQAKERYSMFFMKKELMPVLYWKLMMKGYWNGPALMRKMFSILKFNKK